VVAFRVPNELDIGTEDVVLSENLEGTESVGHVLNEFRIFIDEDLTCSDIGGSVSCDSVHKEKVLVSREQPLPVGKRCGQDVSVGCADEVDGITGNRAAIYPEKTVHSEKWWGDRSTVWCSGCFPAASWQSPGTSFQPDSGKLEKCL